MSMNNQEVREAMQLQINAIKKFGMLIQLPDERELNAIVEELDEVKLFYQELIMKNQKVSSRMSVTKRTCRMKSGVRKRMLTIEQETRQLEKALGSLQQRATTRKSGRNLNE